METIPARILVIDDSALVRQYHRQILEQAGYEVAEAVNGMDGLEKALEQKFDLCVVDVNMPVMDGYAFLHALPALMISTEAAAADRDQALAAGANAYLTKPVPPAALCAYAAAMLGVAS